MTQFANGESFADIRTKLNEAIALADRLRDQSGWANYNDTTYIQASPQPISAATDTQLINDGASSIVTQIPSDYASGGMWSGNRIQGLSGDSLQVLVEFDIDRQSGTGEYDLEVWLDIGGVFTNLFRRYIRVRGNTSRHVSILFNCYCLDTWEANGAAIRLNSSVAANVYGSRVLVTRLHKAREVS